ncbi:hydantoinase/oxoprolinase N-terminal domain-containing protein [Mesobacillus harenae]|uniref:hydantoinase/oxoprolinase N-terminal domain-containing protein n=1 Tax=Mesobacillus harenae TaxID=2213203 RepID=UPI0015805ECA|nr:hydantoinase/oxoprolinase family protein [Mesobacillus harenae]
MNYRIGIDVGGTHTDSVLLDGNLKCVFKIKVATTKDVSTGINQSVKALLQESKVDPASITHAMLGTTHCTNAIVERKNLTKVGVIRLGAPATTAVPPLAGWPEDILEKIGTNISIVSGGYEYDGRIIANINEQEVREVCRQYKGKVQSIAIVGVFSPVNQDQEKQVAEIVKQELGDDIYLSLSNEIGSVGLLERENATVLNAALKETVRSVANGFRETLEQEGIKARIYFGQNDGTLMTSEFALEYPILTIASGPTNSIRGAAHLTGLKDALVVDIGGTTTDIGVLVNGFPRQSSLAVDIGSIRTNFRMPDLLSFGLGGGTVIRRNEEGITIGPDSVGYLLSEKGVIFGGDTLTTTDVAVKLGKYQFENARTEAIEHELAVKADRLMMEMLEEAIDRMKTSQEDVPVILVGGGSILVSSQLQGVAKVYRPENYDAANAIGAALGEVSGETDKVYSLEKKSYEEVIEDAKQNAIKAAIAAGAAPETIKIVQMEDIPLAYLPGNSIHVKVKAAGTLSSEAASVTRT